MGKIAYTINLTTNQEENRDLMLRLEDIFVNDLISSKKSKKTIDFIGPERGT